MMVTFAQQPKKEKGKFVVYEPGYYQNTILKGVEEFTIKTQEVPVAKAFKLDTEGLFIPDNKAEFTTLWHFAPVSQGNTNTCWSYSAVSMLESEIYRLSRQEIKLSEMYIAYNEYLERARFFVKTRGNNYIAEGSEMNAVIKNIKKYGILPYSAYSGLKPGQQFHSHDVMFQEISDYLQGVKSLNAWDEATVIETV